GVEVLEERVRGCVEYTFGHWILRNAGRAAADRLDHGVALPDNRFALVGPRVGDRVDQAEERVGWEVRAAVERLAGGRGEHGHRPATLPGHRLCGRHVDGVDVGALL